MYAIRHSIQHQVPYHVENYLEGSEIGTMSLELGKESPSLCHGVSKCRLALLLAVLESLLEGNLVNYVLLLRRVEQKHNLRSIRFSICHKHECAIVKQLHQSFRILGISYDSKRFPSCKFPVSCGRQHLEAGL